MKKNYSSMEYMAPEVEIQYEELTLFCTSTGATVEELVQDEDFNW